MPGFIGKKLCPDLVFVKPNMDKYKAVTKGIKEILRNFDANIEVPSPDEFVLDVTEFLNLNQINHDMGKIYLGDKIRKLIFSKTKLTASCGVGCNRLLAKVCADYNKPNK